MQITAYTVEKTYKYENDINLSTHMDNNIRWYGETWKCWKTMPIIIDPLCKDMKFIYKGILSQSWQIIDLCAGGGVWLSRAQPGPDQFVSILQ